MTDREVPSSPGLRLAIDYAPLVLFFAVNFLIPGPVAMRIVALASPSLSAMDELAALVIARVIVATAAFVGATVLAMIVSRTRLGAISPMLWITGVLVVVFGGLTLWFHDQRFIQMKPTFVYGIMAAILGFGLLTGRPLLEQLLGTAYPGLTPLGWRKLTVNWMLFFIGMAVLNEIVRQTASFGFWLSFKLWGAIPLTMLFAVANIPMLLRHGLNLDEGRAATDQLPPE